MSIRLRKAINTTKSCDTTSAIALASNSTRKYALFVNSSDVGIWLALGEAAVIGSGAYLAAAGGVYEIDDQNLWTGDVHVIAVSGSGKVLGIQELS